MSMRLRCRIRRPAHFGSLSGGKPEKNRSARLRPAREENSVIRRAMTLVELLVVLAILALLTTVAATSTDVLLSQGRYDATTRTLTGIQEAVLGLDHGRQPDGTTIVSGFVADMGRLPVCTSADATVGLSELWTNSGTLSPFAVQSSPLDPEVVVPCGWRGPYLRLNVGETALRDGWGNPLVLLNLSSKSAAVGDAVAVVQSLGAGSASSSYNAVLNVALASNLQMTVSGNVYVLDSNGQPQYPTDPTQVWVMLLALMAIWGESRRRSCK